MGLKPDIENMMRENAELRARLEEAEETLRAIRNGEVDAIVRSGAEGDQVFTIQGAERPYRLLVEEMPEGAATASADGTLLYANRRLADMLATPLEQLQGSSFFCYVDDSSRPLVSSLLQDGVQTGSHAPLLLKAGDGRVVPAYVAVSPLNLDGLNIACLVITDFSEQAERDKEARIFQKIMVGATQAEDIAAALTVTLRVLTEAAGWEYGEAWLPRYDGEVLEHTAASFESDPSLEPLRRANVEVDLPPGIGLPGRAWISRKTVWVPDLAADKGYFSVATARELGLTSALAVPVIVLSEVVTVLVFYMREHTESTEDKVRMITSVASQIASILQRKVDQTTLREHEVELIQAQEIAHMGNWQWEIREDRMRWSDALFQVYGLTREQAPRTMDGFLQLVHHEDRAAVSAAIRGALRTRRSFEFDCRVVRPDGTAQWLTNRGKTILSESGRPVRMLGVSLDITERKVAERNLHAAYDSLERLVEERTKELSASRLRLQNVLSSITDCYYALDSNWRLVDINDNALTYFGRTREDMLGKTFTEAFPPAQDLALENEYHRAVAEQRPMRMEVHSYVVDKWAEVHGYPGDEGMLYVYFVDITERKRAEAALSESEKRFRDVLDNSRDVIYKLNLMTRTLEYVSPSSRNVTGFSSEELKAMTLAELQARVHPDDRAKYEAAISAFEHPSPIAQVGVIEYRWRHRDGSYVWLSNNHSMLQDSTGRTVGLVGSLRDITPQKRLEEALRDINRSLEREIAQRRETELALKTSEVRYRVIVESQLDLVSRFRTDGTLTFVNESYARFFGKLKEELVGTTYEPVIHPDDIAHVRQKIAAVSVRRPVVDVENRVFDKNGRVHWFQWTNSALFDDEGNVVELMSVGRDFTTRKEAENRLTVQYAVARTIAEATSQTDAMKSILQIICEGLGWDLGILWRLERSRGLRFETIWHTADLEQAMIEQSHLPESDLPARVIKERKTLWVSGIGSEGTTEPARAVAGGFKAVLAFPVRGVGGIVGVVECFSRNPLRPTRDLLQALDALAHQIGNFRDRKSAEDAIRRSAEELEQRVKQRTDQLSGALEALSNSEMRFRTVFEGAPLGIALLSGEGLIMERNPTLERMLGYPDGSLYGRSLFAITQAEDVAESSSFFRELVEGKRGAYRVEHRYIRKDGAVLWGSLSCSLMRFENEQATFVIAMIKDITERKQIERDLRESENRFRTIFEGAPIGISVVDKNGRFIQANPAFLKMIGYTREELITKSVADVTYRDDVAADESQFAELMTGKRVAYQMQKRYVRKTGEITWVNLSSSLLEPGGGSDAYNLRLVEDITDKKAAEQRLRMLGHTITSMNESVVITDIHYNVVSVNKAFLRTFGYIESDVIGRNLTLLKIPGSPRDAIVEILTKTASGGWTGEIRTLRRNGEQFPAVLSTSVVRDETGGPVAFVGILRDITEQKQLQERLAEIERKRSEDLRRFAISVQRAQEDERQRISRELHDDICQRLSGMKLNMEVLEDEVRPKDKKTSRTLRGFKKQFEETIAEVRRLSSNLRPNVLDDFGLAIALNLLAREFQKGHKGVEVKLESDEQAIKHLDPELEIALYRIAQEGLNNIAKHAKANAVTVRLHRVDATIKLAVADNGVGFNPQEPSHHKRPGHGLGLISMKERAELLGGTFEIQSSPDQGTNITVTIPLEVQRE